MLCTKPICSSEVALQDICLQAGKSYQLQPALLHLCLRHGGGTCDLPRKRTMKLESMHRSDMMAIQQRSCKVVVLQLALQARKSLRWSAVTLQH